jgi:hypothetical protein
MNDIYIKQQIKEVSVREQKKLDILARGFEKLEENRKDYIRQITRKLVDIHCGGITGKADGNNLAHGEISGFSG